MPSVAPRTIVLSALLAGFASGCAHGAGTSPGETDAPAPSSTAPPQSGTLVTAEDLQRNPTQPIEQVLMAKVPGITVQRTPDGGIAIRIRGATSVEGRQDPLYVIDGIPIEPGPYGSLTGINPYDIASIEVLKDAASTTMYGLRGANGVILIKTKQPGQ